MWCAIVRRSRELDPIVDDLHRTEEQTEIARDNNADRYRQEEIPASSPAIEESQAEKDS